MPVKEDRGKMMHALKTIVFPYLRSIGFRGSFPHFHRINETERSVDVVTFQFNRYGGSFVIEVACGPAEGLRYKKRFVPPRKMTTWDFAQRTRLGSNRELFGDHWFEFGKNMFNEYMTLSDSITHMLGKYTEISELIVKLLEEYFSKKQASHE